MTREISFEVEVPGTPEQVWDAIATGPGISAWFVPAEIEGGRMVQHHGPGLETASAGVQFSDGVSRALYISALLAVLGAINSWITIRSAARVETPTQPL